MQSCRRHVLVKQMAHRLDPGLHKYINDCFSFYATDKTNTVYMLCLNAGILVSPLSRSTSPLMKKLVCLIFFSNGLAGQPTGVQVWPMKSDQNSTNHQNTPSHPDLLANSRRLCRSNQTQNRIKRIPASPSYLLSITVNDHKAYKRRQ